MIILKKVYIILYTYHVLFKANECLVHCKLCLVLMLASDNACSVLTKQDVEIGYEE